VTSKRGWMWYLSRACALTAFLLLLISRGCKGEEGPPEPDCSSCESSSAVDASCGDEWCGSDF